MQHDASLQIYPLNQELKNWLFSEFWKSCHTTTQLWNECSYCCPPVHQTPVSTALETLDRKSPYFDYYCTKCHFEACVLDPGFVLVQRHSHLLDVARQMLKDRTRDEVKSYILAKYPINPNAFPGDKAVETTVNLCGSLLLMTEIGSERAVIAQFLQRPLLWNGSQTLREAVRAHFQPRKHLQPGIATLGRFFSARNIQQIGGISIKWTCNLADHLLLKDDDQTLFVFHCASFLEHHKSFDNPIYPDGLAEETLQTLKLLLPQSDKKSRLWLGHQIASSRPLQLDHCLARLGPSRSHERRIENFFYWHDRLVILKQAFDDSSPKTLQQWWHDRRNPVQWYTFWVAIIVFVMTLFFGIIQSVEGAMQVYLSWNHT